MLDFRFLVDRLFCFLVFFPLAHWIYQLTASGLFNFCWKSDSLIEYPLEVMICLSLATFKIFSLAFEKFDCNVSSWGSMSSSYLESIEFFEYLYSCLSSNLGNFQPLFTYFLRSLSLLLGLPWWIHSSVWWCPTGPSLSVLQIREFLLPYSQVGWFFCLLKSAF